MISYISFLHKPLLDRSHCQRNGCQRSRPWSKQNPCQVWLFAQIVALSLSKIRLTWKSPLWHIQLTSPDRNIKKIGAKEEKKNRRLNIDIFHKLQETHVARCQTSNAAQCAPGQVFYVMWTISPQKPQTPLLAWKKLRNPQVIIFCQ